MTDQTSSKRPKNDLEPATTVKYYLSNSLLLPEVIKSKEAGKINAKLANMLVMLATRYASKPSFANYTYREDMVAEALADLCKNALKFNPEKSNNPFAFYTSCIHNSFLGYLNVEKKQRRIRDQMLVELGENPSYGFQDEYKANLADTEIMSSLNELKTDIGEARERLLKERLREEALKREEGVTLGLLDFDEAAPETAPISVALLEEAVDVYEDTSIKEDDE